MRLQIQRVCGAIVSHTEAKKDADEKLTPSQRQKMLTDCLHYAFIEQKLTMREAIIRTLETKLNNLINFNKSHTDPGFGEGDNLDDQTLMDSDNDNDPLAETKLSKISPTAELQLLQSQGFYSLSDISHALGMHKDEKTMSRVLIELKKVHRQISEKANRYGRTF